jgi:hypothetical protein
MEILLTLSILFIFLIIISFLITPIEHFGLYTPFSPFGWRGGPVYGGWRQNYWWSNRWYNPYSEVGPYVLDKRADLVYTF